VKTNSKSKTKPAVAIVIGVGPAKKMAKGGKVNAPIKEYGGKEKYPSKTAMMKHEKKEPKKEEKQEKKGVFMAKGGDVKSPKKMAVGGMTALTQPPAPAPAPVKQKTPPAPMPTPVKERPTAAPAPMPAPAPSRYDKQQMALGKQMDRYMQASPLMKQFKAAPPEQREAIGKQLEAYQKASPIYKKQVALSEQQNAQLKRENEMAQLQRANANLPKPTQADLANAPRAQQLPAGAGLGARMLSGEEANKMGLAMPAQAQAQFAAAKAQEQAQKTQSALAAAPTAGTGGVGGPQAQQAQQARPTSPEELPAMAKGGMVKKKSSMKGIINKFIK
jgi:hypothetical protein